ncbi:MAG: mechanosensitive ion channel family protein [Candidatus Nanoarchaeia archaeon]|nr:mechanosensitive ion channel family protein [Candidatus Nanoarchaeia archaeon]
MNAALINGFFSFASENPIYQQISSNKYLSAIVIFIIAFLLSKLIVFIYDKIVSQVTKKTHTKYDDLFVKKTKAPLTTLLTTIGVLIALTPLGLPETLQKIISKIIGTFIVLTLTLIVSRVLAILIDIWGYKWAKRTESSIDDDLVPLFKKFMRVVVIIAGIAVSLTVWNINITGILAGVGVVGIVLGFALQDSLSNIFGGISLILDQSMKKGDKIKLDSGEVGHIQDIGLRSTQLKTSDNQIIIVPNSILSKARFLNFVKPDSRIRVNVSFNVAYGTDVDKVRKLILDLLESHSGILKNPKPEVIFESMGDFSLNFVAKAWISDFEKEYDVRVELNEKIYKTLTKNKIEIPFPTQIVYLKKE